jgi:2-keto-4-pentenoate hydratase/2-oxohepta-3-ene-1,7-dioic acid hydratase in catechol pathway
MKRETNGQHWVLLGTAQASEDIWGLRRITFPSGYYVPDFAYVAPGEPLRAPSGVEDLWVMGGFAFEIGEGGKDIPLAEAHRHVAGYRPWMTVFHDSLLDELRAREHTIMVWDRGVSIFYGLWREACQSLGQRIEVEAYAAIAGVPSALDVAGETHSGVAALEYAHDAAAVIHFMSQFMTLSTGDVYVLGPLVAGRVKPGAGEVRFSAGAAGHSAMVV